MADQYDAVLAKYETQGSSSLSSNEWYLLKQLLREHSARGNRARQIVGV